MAILETIQKSALGDTISASTWMFPTIETIHVFALAIVAGTILVVDLRLLGLASKNRAVTALSSEFLPWTWGAFVVCLITGLLLFVSRAADYVQIAYFPAKFVFMALAGVNMMVFHFVTYKTVDQWDTGEPPQGAKIAGALSLAFWAMVILMARHIGFHL